MQSIKDSFYIALRDRLAALNPARVVTIQNLTRPAIVVLENEIAAAAGLEPDVFYLRWGAAHAVDGAEFGKRPLLRLDCAIEYFVEGSDTVSFQDRGRALAKSDAELLAICAPARTALKDFTQTPPADLAAWIFWTRPQLAAIEAEGRVLQRTAALAVFAFSEVDC
jgi:hypothetical protein